MKTSIRVGALFVLLIAAVAHSAPMQSLQGHVPAAIVHLTPVGRLEATRELKLAIGLPLRDKEGLTNLLQGIYDPASPEYRHYLTPAQFAAAFGPTEEDYRAVTAFAIAHGLKVTATHPNRMVLDVNGTVSDIEQAFHVTLRTYAHPRENRLFYGPDVEPSLELATPVLHISGLDNYLLSHPMNLRRKTAGGASGGVPFSGSGPAGTYMGRDFRAAYVPGLALTGTGQSVGLYEEDGYYTNDIAAYASQAGVPAVLLKNVLLNGFDGVPGANNVEVALDIDLAICMAPGLSSVIVYEGGVADSILSRMATDNLAHQVSASWTYPVDAVTEQIFLQFQAQGQSYFNASGDGDAWPAGQPIAPPCDDPNITSVGGTTLTTSGPGGAWVSETVWNWDIEFGPADDGEGTGGGISPTYTIPPWQTNVSMTANHGSTQYRNLPDVAMIADNVFIIADDGLTGSVGGTSCATPLWAAFVALANEQGAASGRPPLGFINPAIYALGRGSDYTSCFHDITTGNNTWSGSTSLFDAVAGYDLCTGWGTPKGSTLVNLLAPAEPLQISPLGGLAASGAAGGPLTPASQSFVLTDSGTAALNWAAAATVPWLDLSLNAGALTPGGAAATVEVSLNAAASNLFLGTYGATVWFTNLTDGTSQSRAVSLSVIKPPVITAQPAGLALIEGETATFTAGAAGGLPLDFQWQSNGVNLTDGTRVSGSQTTLSEGGNIYGSGVSTLTISVVALADGATYSLLASNAAGVAISSNAVLTISPSAPVILSQPASQEVFVGARAQLAATAAGTAPLTYQWEQNGAKLTDGGGIVGSHTPTLEINGASSDSIGTYTVVVSNAISTATSTGAVLTVQVGQPGGQVVQNGDFETGNFSFWNEEGTVVDCAVGSSAPAVHSGNYGALLGSAGSLGYLSQSLPTAAGQPYLLSLWLDSPDGLAPNEFLVGWNGSVVYDQTNLGAIGWTNLQFYVVATGSNTLLQLGFRDDESFLGLDDIQATLLVSADGPPIIANQPASQSVLAGGAASFSVLAAGRLPLSYQWQLDGTNLANATNATLTLANLASIQAGTYTVLVSNSLGWTLSSNAVLTVTLVGNGGFELGTFADWTTNGSFEGCFVTSEAPFVHSGQYGAALGPAGSLGYLSQTLATTAGQTYGISCWLFCDGENPNEFSVSWNGVTLFDRHNIGDTGWTNLQLQANATAGATLLKFGFRDDPYYLGLDDIAVYLITTPPAIATQPASQSVAAGSAVTFSVGATGTLPLSYFWLRDGAPIAGATASSYTTNNVQLADSGSRFSCLVSNTYGTALSSNALLTVTPAPLVHNGGFELGSFADWTTGGNFTQCTVVTASAYVHSGAYGAQLGPGGSPAYLSQTLATSAGQMYQISCWLYCDGGTPNEFSVSWNGATLFDETNIAATPWTNLQFQASAASTATVLEFGFRDDPSWLGLDDIAVAPIITTRPQFQGATLLTNGAISFSWAAQPGGFYQVQYTTNLALNQWADLNGILSTTNSSITATDATAAATARFYRIVQQP